LDKSHDKSLSSDLLHERQFEQKLFLSWQMKLKNNAPKTIISLPVFWLQHEELGIKMKQFSDAPMHMLFLGVTKHLMAHVDHLFGIQNSSFRTFCGIISKHIEFSKDTSLKWCPIAGFAEAESITITGWQSAQYVAFSRLSLV
jgi:hypothetical protein